MSHTDSCQFHYSETASVFQYSTSKQLVIFFTSLAIAAFRMVIGRSAAEAFFYSRGTRDTMEQVRVNIADLRNLIEEKVSITSLLKNLQ